MTVNIFRAGSLSSAVILAAAILTGIGANSARAELVVTESTAPAYKLGTKLADDARLDVAAGQRLKLTKTPAGTTHVIKGPHQGTLKAYTAGSNCPWYKPWCNKSGDDVGGTRGMGGITGREELPGGTRGITRGEATPGGTRDISPPPATGGTRGIGR